MTGTLYKLAGRRVVRVENSREWCQWFGQADNRVLVSENKPWQISVSTIFLGISYQHCPQGPPMVFETMVFQADDPSHWHSLHARHATWGQAAQYHAKAMQIIGDTLEPGNQRFFDTVVANDDILVSIYRRKFRHRMRDCGA